MVRQCTWCGQPGGSVTGRTAHQVLCECLLLQVHLQQEYTRTIALALLSWQPWLMDRPGCIFVEESGEALLSRFMSSVRQHTQLRGFDNAWRLFITLRAPERHASATRGCVKKELVFLMKERLRCLISRPDQCLYPDAPLSGATPGVWRQSFPEGFIWCPRYTGHPNEDNLRRVLQSSLAVLTSGPVQARDLAQWLSQNVPRALEQQQAHRERAHRRTNQWAIQRAERLRISRVILRPGPAGRSQTARVPQPRPISPPLPEPRSPAVPAPECTEDVASEVMSSLYEPPDDQETALSEGYVSYGDSDGLGSVGELCPDWENALEE